MDRIAIFPASGKLGTSIYTHLARLIDPKRLILVSRHPENVLQYLLEAGVTKRQANYDEPASLDGVFDGASTLVLVSYPSIEKEHRFKVHQTAIDAARHQGVSYIVYTSLAFGGDRTANSVAHVMQAHLLTEKYLGDLAKGGVGKPFSFTAIREGIYSESFPMYTGFLSLAQLTDPEVEDIEVRIPHDGLGPGIAWAQLDNLGEASAKLVIERMGENDRRNDIVLLSGPRTWSVKKSLEVHSEVTGKNIHLRQVSVDEYVDQPIVKEKLGSHGPGNQVPQQWATTFEALRHGECAVPSREFARLLGREPELFGETVKRTLSQSN